MAQVPERVLSWLWSILQTYGQSRLVYNDAVAALTQFPSLKPKTAVYTYENGQTALLLCLFGTLPVEFRAAEYRYPIELWIPQNYGERGAGVICYVKAQLGGSDSTASMAVRPGQHVAMDGRVYHPYLRDWGVYERSTVVAFLHITQGLFAREPPLVARNSQGPQTPARGDTPTPALPPKLRPGQSPAAELSANPSTSGPPPIPSKAGHSRAGSAFSGDANLKHPDGPPLPPLPPEVQSQQSNVRLPVNGAPGPVGFASSRNNFASSSREGAAPPLPPLPLPHRIQSNSGEQSPISPLSPTHHAELPVPRYDRRPPIHHPSDVSQTQVNPDPRAYNLPQFQQQDYRTGYRAPGPPNNQPPQQTYGSPQSVGQAQGQAQAHATTHGRPPTQPLHPVQKFAPAIDLLTDPFDVSLPSASVTGPAPPIPPNPEKEHLLQLISERLTSQVTSKVQQAQSAIAPLTAQYHALVEAQSRLQAEMHQLQSLDTILTTNEHILHQSIRDCQSVIEASRKMPEPNIDEVLVAPTVAAQQLWNLCAEEVAIKEAMYCLQRAVGAGRVSSVEFVRLTRSLARECFLKMALARKIARGLGLEVQGHAGGSY